MYKNEKAITLIALIITIIVMLILVGVTVSIAINGGLFANAKQATVETQYEADKETLLSAVIGAIDNNAEVDYKELDANLPEGFTGNNGKYTSKAGNILYVDKDGNIGDWALNNDGNILYKGKDSGLKVGDYVDYEKYVSQTGEKTKEIEGLYNDLKQYSGYKASTYETTYPITKETDLKWRVLDAKNGKIRLISDKPTNSQVYLMGYNGYNNIVYLVDKVCNTLYTTDKGIVQNLKIEDIQDAMNLKNWDYHDDDSPNVDTKKYNGIKEYSGDNVYYPEIFPQEKMGWVDDTLGTNLGLSEQTDPIKQTDVNKANNKIKITQTFWYKTMTVENWINPIYQYLFINDENSNFETYWLSSRCINAFTDYAGFYTRYIGNGEVRGNIKYDTNDEPHGCAYCLRPVVSLKSDVKIGEKVGDTYSIQ